MRSNREYDYFGNVLEYEYFASYSSMSTSTQKVLVLEYEYTSTITPSLLCMPSPNNCCLNIFHPVALCNTSFILYFTLTHSVP